MVCASYGGLGTQGVDIRIARVYGFFCVRARGFGWGWCARVGVATSIARRPPDADARGRTDVIRGALNA